MRHSILKAFSFAAIAMAAAGCGSEKSSAPGLIDIAGAIKSPAELKTSDLGRTITYIPLETTDSSLVASRFSLTFAPGKVIVSNTSGSLNNDGSVLVFDLSDGSFCNSIGHGGQDPEAFADVRCVSDAGENAVLFKGNGGKCVKYGLDGRFIGIVTPHSSMVDMLPAFVDDTVYVYSVYEYFMKPKPMLSAVYAGKSGVMIDSVVVVPETPGPALELNGGISVFINNSMMRNSLQRGGAIKIGSSPRVYMPGYPRLWRVADGKTHAMTTFSDTIYEVSAGAQPQPVAVISLGEKSFPGSANGVREMADDEWTLSDLTETPSVMILGVKRGDSETPETGFIGYYDRGSGATRMTAAGNGFTDDLSGFMPFYPVAATVEGALVGILKQEDILRWIENHPDAEVPSALQPVIDSEEEPNPVLVIVK